MLIVLKDVQNEYKNNEKGLHLKASFNNVKSEMHGPMCYQCLWYGVILKP